MKIWSNLPRCASNTPTKWKGSIQWKGTLCSKVLKGGKTFRIGCKNWNCIIGCVLSSARRILYVESRWSLYVYDSAKGTMVLEYSTRTNQACLIKFWVLASEMSRWSASATFIINIDIIKAILWISIVEGYLSTPSTRLSWYHIYVTLFAKKSQTW